MVHTTNKEGDSWTEWGRYVLMTIEQAVHEINLTKAEINKLREELAEVKKQLAINTVKLGFFCTAVSSGAALAAKYLLK